MGKWVKDAGGYHYRYSQCRKEIFKDGTSKETWLSFTEWKRYIKSDSMNGHISLHVKGGDDVRDFYIITRKDGTEVQYYRCFEWQEEEAL